MGKLSTAALGGTVAAATAAGVGITAALGGTALAAGAAGLAIAATNQDVKDSYADLGHEISAGMKDAAAPLSDTLLGFRDQIGGTFDELQPRMEGLFRDSVPAVKELADGVD